MRHHFSPATREHARAILGQELPAGVAAAELDYVLKAATELARYPRCEWEQPRDQTERVIVAVAVALQRLEGALTLRRDRVVALVRTTLEEMALQEGGAQGGGRGSSRGPRLEGPPEESP